MKLNAKALFVNHLEKMGFGFIAFLVVMIWAKEYFGGAWSPERRDPNKMLEEIKTKETQINASVWPEAKRKDFELVDFSERAATLLRPINSSKYELSTELFVPLNRPKEKAREPDFAAVESLDALPGHVVLAIDIPSAAGDADREKAAPLNSEEMEDDDEFRRRDSTGGGGLAGGAGPAQIAKAGIMPAPAAAGIMANSDSGAAAGQRPQGRFYVAVRGVWPIRQQMEKYQKALHLPTTSAALDFLDIMDFELERQVATAGEDPWAKPWEKLNIEYANQILEEVDGFDDEPTDMQVFDTVITMPLPKRMFGVWTDPALHPRIEKYVLTPEEQQREKALQARLLEEYEQVKSEIEKQRSARKGGFNRQSNDFRDIGNSMMKNNPAGAQEAYSNMAKEMRSAAPGAVGAGPNLSPSDLSAKITAVGRLLLFRYFDFDVQPGFAYRYRVKLKLRNPNFDRLVTEVIDPSVAEGEDRWTPPSNVSNAAVLPPTPRYFLKDVDKNPLVDEGRARRAVASVAIYDWHREFGTQVSAKVPMKSLGQFLGGEEETKVLDVAEPSLEMKKYQFATEDMLLDLTGDTELTPGDHPDLVLPDVRKGAKHVPLRLVPEAVVINSGGELELLEANGESQEEKSLRLQLDRERRPFRDLKKKDESKDSPLDFTPGGKGGKGAKDAGASKSKGAADANPRRKDKKKKKKGAGAEASLPGMPAMPGATGKSKGKKK